jgi:hypothetical protein
MELFDRQRFASNEKIGDEVVVRVVFAEPLGISPSLMGRKCRDFSCSGKQFFTGVSNACSIKGIE